MEEKISVSDWEIKFQIVSMQRDQATKSMYNLDIELSMEKEKNKILMQQIIDLSTPKSIDEDKETV